MKIQTDKDGAKVIQGLCDIALKSLGLQGLNDITAILNAIKVDEDKPEDKTNV